MIRARLSPRAQRDLDEACNFIASDNPDAAAKFQQTILTAADFLAQHPGVGRLIRGANPRHAQIRWFVVPRYRNYLIFYQPHEETVMVVRILHAAQDWTRFFPATGKSEA